MVRFTDVCIIANVDFVGVPSSLTLSSSFNIGSITFDILDDSLTEQSETIQLFLTTTSFDLVDVSTVPLQIDILDNDGMITIVLH